MQSKRYVGPALPEQWTAWERAKTWPGTRKNDMGELHKVFLQDCEILIVDVEMRRDTIEAAELADAIVELVLRSCALWYEHDRSTAHTDLLRLF